MARQSYQDQLDQLRSDVLYMGELVGDRLRTALSAMESKDDEAAMTVIHGDQEINELYLDLEGDCVDLLALQQPVASDLRFIAASFKIITDLERIGDLATNQTLLIEPPADYSPLRANPSTEIVNGGLQWQGPQTFDRGEPTVVFEAVEPPPPGIERFLSPMAAGIGGVILGAALLVGWRRGYFGNGGPPEAAESTPQQAEPERGPEEVEADTPAPPVESSSEPAVEAELLSDEERVLHLLEENDGRMKQAKIVETTRWSNAKVSQLLSAMAEDGQIEKLRIGRENLISLPDEEES